MGQHATANVSVVANQIVLDSDIAVTKNSNGQQIIEWDIATAGWTFDPVKGVVIDSDLTPAQITNSPGGIAGNRKWQARDANSQYGPIGYTINLVNGSATLSGRFVIANGTLPVITVTPSGSDFTISVPDPIDMRGNGQGVIRWTVGTPGWVFAASNGIDFKTNASQINQQPGQISGHPEIWQVNNLNTAVVDVTYGINLVGPNGVQKGLDPTIRNGQTTLS